MDIKVKIRGVRPLLMHNGDLVDSQTDHAKAKAALTKKKPQTDADKAEIARLDFVGALYYDEQQGRIYIPDVNLLACIVAGAKRYKKGPDAKAGVMIDDHGAFNFPFKGKKTPDALWESGQFTDRRRVVIQRSSVMKVRPVFKQWDCTFTMDIDEEFCSPDDVRLWLETAGKRAGLGDFRPQFGRFEVEEFVKVKGK